MPKSWRRAGLRLEPLEARQLLAADFLPAGALLDFGDLPEGGGFNYRTTLTEDEQTSGPIHLMVPNVYLGGNVDAESDGQPSVDALGDDANFGRNIFGAVLGTSDEDGVNLTSYRDEAGRLQANEFYPGGTARIEVHANVGGYLSAWIDYNADGDFHDVNEQIADSLWLTAGSNLLTRSVPLNAVVGATYARFRFTSYSGDLGPDGVLDNWVLPDGEVEDYRLEIQPPRDFGDAPDSYQTLEAGGGPSHRIVTGIHGEPGVHLGQYVDPDRDGQPDPWALGDDEDAEYEQRGVDDEDGVLNFDVLDEHDDDPYQNGKPYGVKLLVGGTEDVAEVVASTDGFLHAWIDFNRDGDFADPTEQIAASVPLTAGLNRVVFSVPWLEQAGESYARFRFTSVAGNLPWHGNTIVGGPNAGQEVDGEVEDYEVWLEPGSDFGDAPDSYGDAAHHIASHFYLGHRIDGEAFSQIFDVHALGDDSYDGQDDEDGVAMGRTLLPGSTHSVTVFASAVGYLNAWVDFDGDGTFDPTDAIFEDKLLNPGDNELTFTVPAGLDPTKTFARFRFSETTGVGPTGYPPLVGGLGVGEVEDYEVAIGKQDYGDAPDSYHTLEDNLGAAHVQIVGPAPFIGSSPDREQDGQPSDDALGDDQWGPPGGLYGGVSFGSPVFTGAVVRLDQTDGQGTVISTPVSPAGISGLTFMDDGRLFASVVTSGSSSAELMELDPATGLPVNLLSPAANAVAIVEDDGTPIRIIDLATQPLTGVLFGLGGGSEAGELFTIDPETGIATEIGDTGISAAGAIAFDWHGTLFMTGNVGSTSVETYLFVVDPNSASILDGTEVVDGGGAQIGITLAGLGVRPSDGLLFASSGVSGGDVVGVIDPSDGEFTMLGNSGSGSVGDLAFGSPKPGHDDEDGVYFDSYGELELGPDIPLVWGKNTLWVDARFAPPLPDPIDLPLPGMGGGMDTVSIIGYLNAWLDYNHNGTFDPSEQIAIDLPMVAGEMNPVPFEIPDEDFAEGTTFARFRISSQRGLLPLGLAADGEVEDYQVSLVHQAHDYGDAPDADYGTLEASDGPRHVLPRTEVSITHNGVSNLGFESGLLGWETGGTANHVEVLQAANFTPPILPTEGEHMVLLSTGPGLVSAEDLPSLDPPNSDDDHDSSLLWTSFNLSASQVPATISFDWNLLTSELSADSVHYGGRPSLDDFFDVTLNGVSIANGSVYRVSGSGFPDTGPYDGTAYHVDSPGATDGSHFADGQTGWQTFQFVITQAGNYTLKFTVADQDSYDQPMVPYHETTVPAGDFDTGLLVDGLKICVQPRVAERLRLGSRIDAETDGQPTPGALGDDQDRQGDDEDGVTFMGDILPGLAVPIQVEVAGVASNSVAFLDGWIDYNQDGDFDDAGEQFLFSTAVTNGLRTPQTVRVPTTVQVNGQSVPTPVGLTYARIRISSQGQLTPRGEAADGEVEDYLVFVGDRLQWLDYGDAPDSAWIPPLTPQPGDPPDYVTLRGDAEVTDPLDGGPRHAFDPNRVVYLGAGIDFERDGQPAPGADGDDGQRPDLSTPAGDAYDTNDDEDGVQFPASALIPGQEATLRITAATSGYLDAWIDYDQDGQFEPGERIADAEYLGPGDHDWTIQVPVLGAADEPVAFTTYARFRFSSYDSGLPPTGWYSDGEVEDYPVAISNLDFGDAFNDPQDVFDYPTLLSHDGARHIIRPDGPILGWAIDAELDGQPTVLGEARGDDDHGLDDEDGVFLLDPLIADNTVRLVVNVVQAGGYFSGWMDHNRDLEWDDDGELLLFNDSSTAPFLDIGTHVLTFEVPDGSLPGPTSLRFRITSDDSQSLTTRGLAVDGEVEDYVLEVFEADYGDAPDSFGTSIDEDGPRHAISPIYLGATIDAEPNAFPDNHARTDDNRGQDDEDGVTFSGFTPAETPELATGSFVQVEVVSSASDVYLNAWLDFDGSGVFDDHPTEHLFEDVVLQAGSNLLTFFVDPAAADGIRYARFRVSSQPGLGPQGAAWDGEVEDYKLTIVRGLDFGDAPEPDYSTLLQNPADPGSSDPGPYHEITGLYLGAKIDAEPDGQPHPHALGDDLLDGNDDEDGVWFLTPIVPGQMATVRVVSSEPGYLNAWIDFRRDGDWDDSGEHILIDRLTSGGGLADTFTFPVPLSAAPGELTYARFRLSSYTFGGDDLGPDGIVPATPSRPAIVPDGEVEDYQVVLGEVQDWGDAPDGIHDDPPPRYPTLDEHAGARHGILSGVFLGQVVDSESDGQPDNGALGDDLARVDDEDGILWLTPLVPGRTARLEVTASVPGFLNGWIDFNADNDWNDPNEWIVAREIPGGPMRLGEGGPTVIEFWVPETAVVGTTFSRFRFEPLLDATDIVPEDWVLHPYFVPEEAEVPGEVEDHAVVIQPPWDFGDAAASYPTLLADDGPRHVLVSHYHLGAAADVDPDGQPDVLALGDDLDLDGDDEDGVTWPDDPLVPGTPAMVQVEASSSGYLDAWIDVDGDGVFEHPGERILAAYPVNYGSNQVPFQVPLGPGDTLAAARFRFSLQGGLLPTGAASNGEVEDYLVALDPPANALAFDFGDAPSPYPTLLADDGPRHAVLAGIHLGAAIDLDPDGQPAPGVDGDDGARPDLGYDHQDDEDGVTFTSVLLRGESATLDVVASATGMLDAWIDFNRDGDFLDAGEQIFASRALSAGTNGLTYAVPSDAVTGSTVGRFRFSTAGGLSPSGAAVDGEVEDHSVLIPGAVLRLELTDLAGNPLPDDTVASGDRFLVHIHALDNRAAAVGVIGLNVDLNWSPEILEYVGNDIGVGDPGGLPITASFPSARAGSLNQAAGSLNLSAFSTPAAGPPNAAIGSGMFESFATLEFLAEQETSMETLLDLVLGSIVMADNAEVTPVVEDAAVSVSGDRSPEIALSTGQVRFTTLFPDNLDIRNGTESPLVRPNYPDATKFFEVRNAGGGTLRIDNILFHAALAGDVTISPLPTPMSPILLAAGEMQRFDLVFAPSNPVTPVGGSAGTLPDSFDLTDGLVVVSNAANDATAELRLLGASTYNCDISYDGTCGVTDRNLLENSRFFNNPANYDPSLDMDGDGEIDLPDAGVINVEFGRVRPLAADDTQSTAEGVSEAVNVAANDTAIPAGSVLQVAGQAGGTATVNNNGTPGNPADDRIDFLPDSGFTGEASFLYGWYNGGQLVSNVARGLVSVTPASPLLAASSPQIAGDGVCVPLTIDPVSPLLEEAVRLWSAALPEVDVAGVAAGIQVRVQDLGGETLGLATDGLLLLDDDAAGHQWFVDPTPGDSLEFAGDGSALGGEAAERIDLLTVVVHELGHLLGLDDVHDPGHQGVMAARLDVATRRLPTAQPLAAGVVGPARAESPSREYEQAADWLFAELDPQSELAADAPGAME